MGLDNFWEMPEGKEDPSFDPPLNLCGGMFSGHGSGSFRGKVYNGIVEAVTGVSLYEDKILNRKVKAMAKALRETTYDEAMEKRGPEGYEISREDYEDLQAMFTVYADAGATLTSWY